MIASQTNMAGFWKSVAENVTGGRNIFISYRHEYSAGDAGRLFDRLSAHFPGRVFRDVSGIEPGSNFADRIAHELSSCRVFIVVIGKRWINAVDESGTRRLDLPNDWVRIEIAKALERNILVIPLLTGGAQMPTSEQLPADLRPLTFRQAEVLNDDVYFDHHVKRLVECLEREVGSAQKLSPGPGNRHWIRNASIAVVALFTLLAIIGYANRPDVSTLSSPSASIPQTTSIAQRAPESTVELPSATRSPNTLEFPSATG
jgi:TIR domain